MGLLDDAIREHLDLKRRRGADPAEVARLEQEALGPVRREPAPAAEAVDPAQPAEVAHADEPAVEEHRAHEPEPEHEHEPAPAAPEHAPVPHAAEESHLHAAEQPHVLPPEERHDPPHGDPLSQPTTEYRVEDHHHDDDEAEHAHAAHDDDPETHDAPEPAGPREDVLEETPDFLQETPEHDRLWFEQRPPRDFDFDG